MTPCKPCLSAPGPMEAYAEQFDELFGHRAQRQGFRDYLLGLQLPRERRKTLPGVIGTEPILLVSLAGQILSCSPPRKLS